MLNQIDKLIVEFINKHHVLTLATINNNEPWCANCFYSYLVDENCLIITSDYKTKHIQDIILQPHISGSIVLETKIIGKIQGIQFRGLVFKPEGELLKKAEKQYLKRFPVARLMDTNLWAIDITYIKMTHNMLGFGKKLIWEKCK